MEEAEVKINRLANQFALGEPISSSTKCVMCAIIAATDKKSYNLLSFGDLSESIKKTIFQRSQFVSKNFKNIFVFTSQGLAYLVLKIVHNYVLPLLFLKLRLFRVKNNYE